MKGMRTEMIQKLKENAEPAYREFTMRLVPNAGSVIGVRMPVIRRIAAEILRADPIGFLQETRHEYFEEDQLAAIIAGRLNASWQVQQKWYRRQISSLTNWSVCDTFCASLRRRRGDPEQLYALVLHMLASSREFDQRFALVTLLDCFAKQRSREILALLPSVQTHGYYADMAEAWLIAECAIYEPEQAVALLPLLASSEIQKKAIRKMAESYRISDRIKDAARQSCR